MSFSFS